MNLFGLEVRSPFYTKDLPLSQLFRHESQVQLHILCSFSELLLYYTNRKIVKYIVIFS